MLLPKISRFIDKIHPNRIKTLKMKAKRCNFS